MKGDSTNVIFGPEKVSSRPLCRALKQESFQVYINLAEVDGVYPVQWLVHKYYLEKLCVPKGSWKTTVDA